MLSTWLGYGSSSESSSENCKTSYIRLRGDLGLTWTAHPAGGRSDLGYRSRKISTPFTDRMGEVCHIFKLPTRLICFSKGFVKKNVFEVNISWIGSDGQAMQVIDGN